jgi:putative Holliday junction resolvase
MAFPRETIVRTTKDALFARLLEIISTEQVERIVVGMPLGLDGQVTETTRQVRNFIERLKRRTEVPVESSDERLTSFQAEDDLWAAGVNLRKNKKNKEKIDQQAAVRLLQAYLDEQRKKHA